MSRILVASGLITPLMTSLLLRFFQSNCCISTAIKTGTSWRGIVRRNCGRLTSISLTLLRGRLGLCCYSTVHTSIIDISVAISVDSDQSLLGREKDIMTIWRSV